MIRIWHFHLTGSPDWLAEQISTINLNQIASMSQYWLGLTERAVQCFRFCGFCHWRVSRFASGLPRGCWFASGLPFWQLIRKTWPFFFRCILGLSLPGVSIFFQKQNTEVLKCINRKFYRIFPTNFPSFRNNIKIFDFSYTLFFRLLDS